MRRCVGSAFAQFEMRAVLRAVLTNFDIEAAGGPERITRRSLTIVPDRGGRVRVLRRVEAGSRDGAEQGALAV
jgi:cytochrome P450